MLDHGRDAELVQPSCDHGHADEAGAVVSHEADVIGGDELGCDYQVALVFAILVVHDDDELAGFEVG